jgi:phosphonate transport system substrate-binding protein
MHHTYRILFLALLLLISAAPLWGREIIFSPLPMMQPSLVARHARPMLSYLEQELNEPIGIEYHKNYEKILSAFCRNRIDLAFLGPLPYINLKKRCDKVVPIVRFVNKKGKATYTCSIITDAEIGVKRLQDLAGGKVALTQPLSTCGYLMTDFLLRGAGLRLEDARYRYVGNHRKVALAVIRGEADAGGIKTSIAHKYEHLGIRFLAQTPPLPGFLLVANGSTMTRREIEKIRNALLNLHPLTNPEDAHITSCWGEKIRYGAVPVNDSDYDIIRNELARMSIPATDTY